MDSFSEKFYSTEIPIVEIFKSVSGEGISAGNIVTFIRVAGCDLRCTWCDTKYSFKESGKDIDRLLPIDIYNKLIHIETKEIICTGGEPLEHGKTKRYLPAYLHSKGFKVRIETSGGSNLYTLDELSFFNLCNENRPVYTMDIKCPGSGMSERNNFKNLDLLNERDELKFVVADDNDLEYALDLINLHKNHLSERKIFLNFSPVFDSMEAVYLVDFLKKNSSYFEKNNLRVRLSLQIHKFIWPPHQRGV